MALYTPKGSSQPPLPNPVPPLKPGQEEDCGCHSDTSTSPGGTTGNTGCPTDPYTTGGFSLVVKNKTTGKCELAEMLRLPTSQISPTQVFENGRTIFGTTDPDIMGNTIITSEKVGDGVTQYQNLQELMPVTLLFNNGLTRTGNTVALGGTLLANTNIDPNGHTLTFNSTIAGSTISSSLSNPGVTSGVLNYSSTVFQATLTDLVNNSNNTKFSFTQGGGSMSTVGKRNTGGGVTSFFATTYASIPNIVNLQFGLNNNTNLSLPTQKTIYIDDSTDSGIYVTDSSDKIGFIYDADYSAKGELNPLWVPNWGAVTTAIASIPPATPIYFRAGSLVGAGTAGTPYYPNAGNGLTPGDITDGIVLGGSLDRNTTITTGAYSLTVNGTLRLANAPLIATDVVRLSDLELTDRILSGMVTTVSGTTSTTTAGTYRISNIVYTLATSTNVTIPVQDATLSRFSVIYANSAGALNVVNGALAASPIVPSIPGGTVLVSTILITPTSITTTPPPSSSINANNGLTIQNGYIQLGGPLVQPTTVNYSSSAPLNFIDSSTNSGILMTAGGSGQIQFRSNNGTINSVFSQVAGSTSFLVTSGANSTGYTNSTTSGLGITDQIFNIGVTGAALFPVSSNNQYAQYGNIELTNAILTGMTTTASGTTATTASGTYRINNITYTLASSTNTTIPAQDATLSRYTIIYANTSGALAATNGTLSASPVEPSIPANTVAVATILITPTAITVTPGKGKGSGTVTQVTGVNNSYYNWSIANSTSTPALTLTPAPSGVTAGSYTNANITVDTYGRITVAASGSGGGITALTGDVTASGSGSVTATLANTAVTAGSYTNANITVDSKGRITAASNGSSGISGSGTTGYLPYWTSSSVQGNSPYFTDGFHIMLGTNIYSGLQYDQTGTARIQGNLGVGQLSPISGTPGVSTLGTGGAIPAGTYYYKITVVDYNGNQTTASTEVSATLTGSTSKVTLTWPAVTGATAYNIYRGTSSGGENIYYTSSTNSYVDVNGTSTIGTVPTVNSSAMVYVNSNGTVTASYLGLIGLGGGNIVTNIAGGTEALLSNTTGANNAAFGYHAGRNITSSSSGFNTFIGALAAENATGTTAVNNAVIIGYNALHAGAGIGPTLIGSQAAPTSTGNNVTGVGYSVFTSLTTGHHLVGLGVNAGAYYGGSFGAATTINHSIYIGDNAYASADGVTNEVVIGDTALGKGSNTTTIGNNSTIQTYLYGNVQGSISIGSAEITFANAPSSPYTGQMVNFSDANTAGGVITAGGGTNHVPARWNGTNWETLATSTYVNTVIQQRTIFGSFQSIM